LYAPGPGVFSKFAVRSYFLPYPIPIALNLVFFERSVLGKYSELLGVIYFSYELELFVPKVYFDA
jgi:hypothetical protein